jgi:hypothetical protein
MQTCRYKKELLRLDKVKKENYETGEIKLASRAKQV